MSKSRVSSVPKDDSLSPARMLSADQGAVWTNLWQGVWMEVVHRLTAGSQLEGYCCSSGEGTLAWAGRRVKGKGRGLGTGSVQC